MSLFVHALFSPPAFYMLPRLQRLWTHLERQGGGSGAGARQHPDAENQFCFNIHIVHTVNIMQV